MVVAQVVHDGRTYLEPISSSAKSIIENAPFLLEQSKKGDLVRKYYPTYGQTIKTGTKGLSSLFKSLDPISGRRRGRPLNFSALQVVQNSLNLVADEVIEADISVDVDIDKGILLYGYAGDLQSALMNIFHNAIHWLCTTQLDEKNISLRATVEGEHMQISIINNGPLIDEEDVSTIFDAGFSLKSDGHGLGLAIAREACRNSKGELYLSTISTQTNFIIDFPIQRQDAK
jgi:signal transduction histidine kinase